MEDATQEGKQNLFGFALTSIQNASINHLLPAVLASHLFILIIATDIGVIFRHYKDDNPIWGSLTLFFLYLPAIGSFIIIVTDFDYWPEPENGMTSENTFWLCKKTLYHLLFPLWNVWRFAERIFWSIEATRSKTEESAREAIQKATDKRLIELYGFLQAYLHCLPQVLLQLHILMRHNSDIAKESKNVQALCIILNLAKVAVTTTYYQRFKAQKLTGSQYPWLKSKKIARSTGRPKSNLHDDEVMLRRSYTSQQRRVIENRATASNDITRLYDIQPAMLADRRRSSDIYLEPEPVETVVESSQINTNTQPTRNSYLSRLSSMFHIKPVSTVDSFNIKRLNYTKGLQEDDMAGKTVSFIWWFTFLLGRVLAISVFAYFFMKTCFWLLFSHVILVITILLYDVRSDSVKRHKSVFFLFIGIVYVFCIIEFKIRFKKTNFIYLGYFGLMYLENCIMCVIWYIRELESLENDYWFRYTFYCVIASGILSLSAMIFYHILTKPKSVSITVH